MGKMCKIAVKAICLREKLVREVYSGRNNLSSETDRIPRGNT